MFGKTLSFQIRPINPQSIVRYSNKLLRTFIFGSVLLVSNFGIGLFLRRSGELFPFFGHSSVAYFDNWLFGLLITGIITTLYFMLDKTDSEISNRRFLSDFYKIIKLNYQENVFNEDESFGKASQFKLDLILDIAHGILLNVLISIAILVLGFPIYSFLSLMIFLIIFYFVQSILLGMYVSFVLAIFTTTMIVLKFIFKEREIEEDNESFVSPISKRVLDIYKSENPAILCQECGSFNAAEREFCSVCLTTLEK